MCRITPVRVVLNRNKVEIITGEDTRPSGSGKINYEFKILYAIGILLVISGHFGSRILSMKSLFPYDTFHMPLFVFVSGYFFKPTVARDTTSLWQYIKRKIRRLIIPYYLWNAFYVVLGTLLNQYTILEIPIATKNLRSFFLEPILVGHGAEYNVAAWFLVALFLVEILYAVLQYCSRRLRIYNRYAVMGFLFAVAVSVVCLSYTTWESPLRVVIIRTGYLLFWYGAGEFYRHNLEKNLRRINNWAALIVIVLIACCLYFFCERGTDTASYIFATRFYPNLPYVFFRAGLGIAFWLRAAYILTPYLKNNNIVLYIANHTFSLMVHQGLAGIVLNSLIRAVYPDRIDDAFWTTHIWYAFKHIHGVFSLYYVIMIPVLVLGCVYIYDRIRAGILAKRRQLIG